MTSEVTVYNLLINILPTITKRGVSSTQYNLLSLYNNKMAKPLLTFVCGVLFFCLLWAIALAVLSTLFSRRTKNEKEKKQYMTMAIPLVTIAAILMFTMWLCCFLHQMHPLIIPDLTKHVEEELKEGELYSKSYWSRIIFYVEHIIMQIHAINIIKINSILQIKWFHHRRKWQCKLRK